MAPGFIAPNIGMIQRQNDVIQHPVFSHSVPLSVPLKVSGVGIRPTTKTTPYSPKATSGGEPIQPSTKCLNRPRCRPQLFAKPNVRGFRSEPRMPGHEIRKAFYFVRRLYYAHICSRRS
jgi:hypothetical protein